MNPIEARRKKLHLLLSAAYRQRQEDPFLPDPDRRSKVMSAISKAESPGFKFDPWAFLDRLVWRLVPAAGAVALLLALLVIRAAPDPAAELSQILSTDSTVTGLYTFYQGESSNE